VLPFLEVTVGIALVSGAYSFGASAVAMIMFLVFTLAQGSATLRGIDAECGCFGRGERVTGWSILRTSVFMAGSAYCFVRFAVGSFPKRNIPFDERDGRASSLSPNQWG
jgi:hypothetical protein